MMQRFSARIPRPSPAFLIKNASSSTERYCYTTFSLQTPLQRNVHKEVIPNEFRKWGSLGFCRNSKFATGYAPLQRKPLDSIFDVERAKSCSPQELVSVWDHYHLGRGHIGVSMNAKLYHLLEQRPTFCHSSAERKWLYNYVHSRCHTCFSWPRGLQSKRNSGSSLLHCDIFYTEFADSKDVVLIRGDVVLTSKLSDAEAHWLLETAQSFYLNDTKYKLVDRFKKETHEFEFKMCFRHLRCPWGENRREKGNWIGDYSLRALPEDDGDGNHSYLFRGCLDLILLI